jgi:hypothetical protein
MGKERAYSEIGGCVFRTNMVVFLNMSSVKYGAT